MIILIYEYNEQELIKEGPGFWLSHIQTGFWLQPALKIECVPWPVGLGYEKGLQSKEAAGRPIRHPWVQSWESFSFGETPASTSSSATSIAIDDPVRTKCLQGNVGLKASSVKPVPQVSPPPETARLDFPELVLSGTAEFTWVHPPGIWGPWLPLV